MTTDSNTGSNGFNLRNRRSEKIILLSKSAVESYTQNGTSIRKFQKALEEAKKLKVEENIKKKTVVVCKFNLYVASICTSCTKPDEAIEQLTKLLSDAEEYEPSLIPDIWYYIGRGYLIGEDTASALEAFKQAKEKRCAKPPSDWRLHESNNDLILRFETDDRKVMPVLRENIELKARKGPESDSYIDDIVEVMEMTYRYFDTLLKENAQEAKKEANNLIRLTDFANATKLENEDKDLVERKITSSMWCDIGLIYTQLQCYSEAHQCFYRARDMKEDKTAESTLQISHNIAAVWVLKREFKGAVEVYESTGIGNGKNSIKNKDLLLHVYLNWAFCYLRLEQTEKAYNFYSKAFDIALNIGDMHSVRYALDGLIATVLTLEKSAETMERFKLKLGLLDCDDVSEQEAKTAKEDIDKRREHFLEIAQKHTSKTGVREKAMDPVTDKKDTVTVNEDIGLHDTANTSKTENGMENKQKKKFSHKGPQKPHGIKEADTSCDQPSINRRKGSGESTVSQTSDTKSKEKKPTSNASETFSKGAVLSETKTDQKSVRESQIDRTVTRDESITTSPNRSKEGSVKSTDNTKKGNKIKARNELLFKAYGKKKKTLLIG